MGCEEQEILTRLSPKDESAAVVLTQAQGEISGLKTTQHSPVWFGSSLGFKIRPEQTSTTHLIDRLRMSLLQL